MPSQLGGGICQRRTSAASAKCTSTAHVRLANTPVTIAASVSQDSGGPSRTLHRLIRAIVVCGKCGHNFHMVSGRVVLSSFCSKSPGDVRTLLTFRMKHCIMEWIKQESAKGQCPMCRQSEWALMLLLLLLPPPLLRVCFVSNPEACTAEFEWGGSGENRSAPQQPVDAGPGQ